jgi:hypothetical protein
MFPSFYEISMKVLLGQGSTARVERLISQAGHILSLRRPRLSPHTSEMLISLRSVQSLLSEGETCVDLANRLLFERRQAGLPLPPLFDSNVGTTLEDIICKVEKDVKRAVGDKVSAEIMDLEGGYDSDSDGDCGSDC